MITEQNINDMADGWITAALWADGVPLDYDPETGECGDLQHLTVPESDRRRVIELCKLFVARNANDLLTFAHSRSFDPSEGSVWDHVGHDLYLTSAHHGTGFWDREPHDMRNPDPAASDGVAAFMSARQRLATAAHSKPFDVAEHAMIYQTDENTATIDAWEIGS